MTRFETRVVDDTTVRSVTVICTVFGTSAIDKRYTSIRYVPSEITVQWQSIDGAPFGVYQIRIVGQRVKRDGSAGAQVRERHYLLSEIPAVLRAKIESTRPE